MSRFRLFDLNPQQYQAATHPEGALLILAGAGTGKTRVVTARIAWLISQGVAPSQILAVTFTNKAAREMQERVKQMVGKQAEEVTLSTFHALCVKILRRDAPLIGYKESFTILDDADQSGILKKMASRIHDQQEKLDVGLARGWIGKQKNQGKDYPEEVHSALGSLFARYQQELQSLNAMDFDDLLLKAVILLRDFPEVRAYWQERYRYLFIDEFQDTNQLQWELILQLVGASENSSPNLCVVGDDDQSIYSWRGAQSGHLLRFEEFFPAVTVIKLEQNYRSTDLILGAANRLIQNNQARRKKQLWSETKEGAVVRLLTAQDDQQEAEFIADEILQRVGPSEGGTFFEQFAILYRMNTQSRLFETALRERNIPYRVVGGKSFFDRREIRDVMAYLGALLNPDDDNALLRVLQNPPCGIGKVTLNQLLERSTKEFCSLSELFEKLFSEFSRSGVTSSEYSSKMVDSITRFAERWGAYRIRFETPGNDPAHLLDEILEETGYFEDLRKHCKTPEEADQRTIHVKELLHSMRLYCQEHREKRGRKGSAVQAFLDSMTLQKEKEEDKEQKKGVTLMTLHAAKGLEFPYVYLVGLEEGVLPHQRSRIEGNIDEERRLCYVGMTRAQKELTITYATTRKKYKQLMTNTPSSFLEEIQGEGVEEATMEEVLSRPLEDLEVDNAFAQMRFLLDSDED